MISHLCYCYFRAAKIFEANEKSEQVLKSFFLCTSVPHPLLEKIKPAWNEHVYLPAPDKLKLLGCSKEIGDLFPFAEELSETVNASAFASSLLQQPDLFIRIRPGNKEKVIQKIKEAGINPQLYDEMCLALPNGTPVEKMVVLNKEAVVQDYSSQRVGELMQLTRQACPGELRIWDCCAASGGKSLLAKDILGHIRLTVSDVRETILVNLRKRFLEAGISEYTNFVADLSGNQKVPAGIFDLVIADVPCSGSGTWSRTPEQLFFFDPAVIERYAALQKKIVTNVIQNLAPGGFLLYSTCSVFRKENEDMAAYMAGELTMMMVKTEVLTGYDKKADTLFAALFQKPL